MFEFAIDNSFRRFHSPDDRILQEEINKEKKHNIKRLRGCGMNVYFCVYMCPLNFI